MKGPIEWAVDELANLGKETVNSVIDTTASGIKSISEGVWKTIKKVLPIFPFKK